MTAPAVEQQDQARQVASTAAEAAAQAWAEVDAAAITTTWTQQLPAVVATVTAAQTAAAALAAPAVAGIASTALAPVVAAALAGIASTGLPLAAVLVAPAVAAIGALAASAPAARGLAAGAAVLDMIVRTQVTDAGRVATGVAITATPEIAGHERVVHLPACSRCIVLAGRLYRWSEGFARHPRCDCTMVPVTSEEWRTRNLDNHPRALFDQLDPAEQDKRFGAAGAQAIRDGADPVQVVNARSGMRTASVGGREILATTTGVTRRGTAGQRLSERFGTAVVSEFERNTRTGGRERVRLRGSRAPRLMPETIYQVAEDRDHAIRLLRLHGYLL